MKTRCRRQPVRAVTLPGDVWVLGDHRVLCGDSTQMEAR